MEKRISLREHAPDALTHLEMLAKRRQLRRFSARVDGLSYRSIMRIRQTGHVTRPLLLVLLDGLLSSTEAQP